MKATSGKANPALVNDLLRQKLAGEPLPSWSDLSC